MSQVNCKPTKQKIEEEEKEEEEEERVETQCVLHLLS